MTRQSEQAERDRDAAKRLEGLNADEVIRIVESIMSEPLTQAGRMAVDACRLRGRVIAGSKNGTTLKALQVRGVLTADMYGIYRFSEEVVRRLERDRERRGG